jgi:hypothetical protein
MGKVSNTIMFALTKRVCTPVPTLPSDGHIYKYVPYAFKRTVFHFATSGMTLVRREGLSQTLWVYENTMLRCNMVTQQI